MGNSGTGDVAGVSVGDGRSENMMDDGIDKCAPTLRVYFRNFIRIFWYF